MKPGDVMSLPIKVEEVGQDGTVFARVRTGRGLWLDAQDVFPVPDERLSDDPKPPKTTKAKLAPETK